MEKMKPWRILLIRDEGDGVESGNMQRDETMCVLDVGKKKKRRGGIKGCSPLRGHGLECWIISALAECRFSPPDLTSSLDSSAHIHLFNLGKRRLMSYILY